jgi:hypothetical protein
MAMRRKVLAGATAAVVVGGTGAGLAATKLTRQSPSEESKAIVNDAAKNLGVSPSKLSAAIKKAYSDRIDAAVKDGRLTKAEGEQLKQRILSDDFPLFGAPALGRGFPGVHPFFHGLDAAASYLGLTEAQLRTRIGAGKTLAEIAKAENKSVDGLKSALVKDVTDKLDAAVKAGRLTKAEEQRALQGLESRIDDLVNGKLRARFREHRGFGMRGFDRHGPPAFDRQGPPAFPDAAA